MQGPIQLPNQQQVGTSDLLLQQLSRMFFSIPIDGLAQLRKYCSSMYNPQSQLTPWTAERSFIKEGGSDPLDLIDIFKHEANAELMIPEHWHFIGYGLSDIYNYRSQYEANPETLFQYYPPRVGTSAGNSGFGIELTLRVKCHEPGELPPTWPIMILQNLAKYIFQTRIICDVGDHVAFNHPLNDDESLIKHVLMMEDPMLKTITTPTGRVKFIQLVGVCDEELEAARQWNVMGMLDIMREHLDTGGSYLVTDTTRGANIFQKEPEAQERVKAGIDRMGSDMSSISTRHKYSHCKPSWYKFVERAATQAQEQQDGFHDIDQEREDEPLNADHNYDDDDDDDEDHEYSRRYALASGVERGNIQDLNREETFATNNLDQTRPQSRMSNMSYASESELLIPNVNVESARFLRIVYLLINQDSARMFPVVLMGRLKHDRLFSFQNCKGDLTTVFVPAGAQLENSQVSSENPLVKCGPLLFIYVSKELLDLMIETIGTDFSRKHIELPRNYSWPEHNLYITVTKTIEDVTEDKS